jgi:hypothetical protein
MKNLFAGGGPFFFTVPLPVVPGKYSADREILIQIGPMQPKRRNFNIRERALGFIFQARIALNGETEIQAAGHRDMDPAFAVHRFRWCVNQCAHAIY